MNNLEVRENCLPSVKVWNGQPVVTFKDIDEVHDRTKGTARQNFSRNKKHFIENEDYYIVTRKQLNESNCHIENIPPRGLTLITESGYLLIVKSFTDDKSWEVQKQLVKSYFRQKEAVQTAPAFPTESITAVPLRPDGYRRNKDKMTAICEHHGIERRKLYSRILKSLNEIYDLEAAREMYKKERGHYPKYAMDTVWYFQNLTEAAEEIIDDLMERCIL